MRRLFVVAVVMLLVGFGLGQVWSAQAAPSLAGYQYTARGSTLLSEALSYAAAESVSGWELVTVLPPVAGDSLGPMWQVVLRKPQ